jgi:hypothetical protein
MFIKRIIGISVIIFFWGCGESNASQFSPQTTGDTTNVHAGDSSGIMTPHQGIRFAGGFGGNDGFFPGDNVTGYLGFTLGYSITYQYGIGALNLRYYATDAVPAGGAYPEQKMKELALVIGINYKILVFFLNAGIGLGYEDNVLLTGYVPPPDSSDKFVYDLAHTQTFGLAYQIQLSIDFTNNFGMSFMYFKDLNKVFNNGAIVIGFEVGAW